MLHLELELLSDICMSASNKTLGDAETHDFIPGRLLWGAVASQFYESRNEAEAFEYFQRNKVRFSDGVPLYDSRACVPAPRSLHLEKGSAGTTFRNLALDEVRKSLGAKQYKPISDGWLTPDGQWCEPQKNFSMRTAMDGRGRARDGLLFGIPSLRRGARFYASVDGSAEILKCLTPMFTGAPLRLGRSRNSEFGLVGVTLLKEAPRGLSLSKGKATKISFLCVGRCLFRDARTGAQTLEPGSEAFGLPASWKLDHEATFLRATRIVHFHGKRQRPERERFAIERGSVLTFAGPKDQPVDLDALRGQLSRVGECQGDGYGQIVVAPEWLTASTVDVRKTVGASRPKGEAATPPDELFRWALGQAESREKAMARLKAARDDAQQLKKYRVPNSQWGVVRQLARESRYTNRDNAALMGILRELLDSGKRRLSPQWKRARPTFFELLESRQSVDLSAYLEALAAACMRPGKGPEEMESDQ